jgi:hypothetical protein
MDGESKCASAIKERYLAIYDHQLARSSYAKALQNLETAKILVRQKTHEHTAMKEYLKEYPLPKEDPETISAWVHGHTLSDILAKHDYEQCCRALDEQKAAYTDCCDEKRTALQDLIEAEIRCVEAAKAYPDTNAKVDVFLAHLLNSTV